MLAKRLNALPRGPEKPLQGRIRRAPASRQPRARISRWIASGNVRRYDWTASSGSVVANDPINGVDPTGRESFLVARGVYESSLAHHTFVVLVDDQTGTTTFYSFTDEGGSIFDSRLVRSVDGGNSGTLAKDVKAWQNYNSGDSDGVSATRINAPDSDVKFAGDQVSGYLGREGSGDRKPVDYDARPAGGQGCNSNCAAFAVANIARDRASSRENGFPASNQAAPAGSNPVGQGQAGRVEGGTRDTFRSRGGSGCFFASRLACN